MNIKNYFDGDRDWIYVSVALFGVLIASMGVLAYADSRIMGDPLILGSVNELPTIDSKELIIRETANIEDGSSDSEGQVRKAYLEIYNATRLGDNSRLTYLSEDKSEKYVIQEIEYSSLSNKPIFSASSVWDGNSIFFINNIDNAIKRFDLSSKQIVEEVVFPNGYGKDGQIQDILELDLIAIKSSTQIDYLAGGNMQYLGKISPENFGYTPRAKLANGDIVFKREENNMQLNNIKVLSANRNILEDIIDYEIGYSYGYCDMNPEKSFLKIDSDFSKILFVRCKDTGSEESKEGLEHVESVPTESSTSSTSNTSSNEEKSNDSNKSVSAGLYEDKELTESENYPTQSKGEDQESGIEYFQLEFVDGKYEISSIDPQVIG